MVWPVLDIDCCQNYTDSHVQEDSSKNHVCCDKYINLLNQKGELCTIFSVRHVVTKSKGLLVAIRLDNFLPLINSSSKLVIWHDLRSVPYDNFIEGTKVTFDAFYLSEDIGYQIVLMWIGEKPKCLSFPCLDSKLIRYHKNIPCAIDEFDKSKVELILEGKEHLLKIPASHESNQFSPILNISNLRADVIESRKRGSSNKDVYDLAIHIIYSVVEGDPDQWKHMFFRDVNVHAPTNYHKIFFYVLIELIGNEWYFCTKNENFQIKILNKDSIPRRKTYKAHVIKFDQHSGVAIVLNNQCSNFAGVDSNQKLPDCSCIKMIDRLFLLYVKPNNEKHLGQKDSSMKSKIGREKSRVQSCISSIVNDETSSAVGKVSSTDVLPKVTSLPSLAESTQKSAVVKTKAPLSINSYQKNESSENAPDHVSTIAKSGTLVHTENIDSSESKLIGSTVERNRIDDCSEPDSEDYLENDSTIVINEKKSESNEFIPISTPTVSEVNDIVKMMIEGSSGKTKTLIETHSNMIRKLKKMNSCDIHHHLGHILLREGNDSYGIINFKSGKIFVSLDKITANMTKITTQVGVYYFELREMYKEFKYFAVSCHTGPKLPYYNSLWKWINAVEINSLETFIKGTLKKMLSENISVLANESNVQVKNLKTADSHLQTAFVFPLQKPSDSSLQNATNSSLENATDSSLQNATNSSLENATDSSLQKDADSFLQTAFVFPLQNAADFSSQKGTNTSLQHAADSAIKDSVLSVIRSIVNDSFPVAIKSMETNALVQYYSRAFYQHKPQSFSGTLKLVNEYYGETNCHGGKIFIPLTCIYPSPVNDKRINFQYYSLKKKYLGFSGFGVFGFTKPKPFYVANINKWIEKVTPIELENIFHDSITWGIAKESSKDNRSFAGAIENKSSITPVHKTVPFLGTQSEKESNGKQLQSSSRKDGDLNNSHRTHKQNKGKIILNEKIGLGLLTACSEELPITAGIFYLYGVCLKKFLLTDVIVAGMEVDYILSHKADGSKCVERVSIGGNDTGKLSPDEVKALIKEWCLAHSVHELTMKQIISNLKMKKSSKTGKKIASNR